jgi:NADH:ubiquinone oxidoreductase subunit 3 (subunit A)
LTEINQQITNLLEEGKKINNEQISPSQYTQQQSLLKNYHHLVKERKHIKNLLNQYQDTERELEEGNIVITKNYYTYILLFLLAIVIVFILIKLSLPTNTQYGGGKMSNNILYILFFILSLMLVIHFFK